MRAGYFFLLFLPLLLPSFFFVSFLPFLATGFLSAVPIDGPMTHAVRPRLGCQEIIDITINISLTLPSAKLF